MKIITKYFICLCLQFSSLSALAIHRKTCLDELGRYRKYTDYLPGFRSSLIADLVNSTASGNNIVVPVSAIYSVLTTVALGAEEGSGSRQELLMALKIPTQSTFEDIVKLYGKSFADLRANGDGVHSPIFRQVSSILVDPTIQIRPQYRVAMSEEFGAHIGSVTSADIIKIDELINLATGEKLRGIRGSFNTSMKFVLVGASSFKGAWMYPMAADMTRSYSFHPDVLSLTSTYEVNMMQSLGAHGFLENEHFQIVELAFRGPSVETELNRPRYSTLLILPKGNFSLRDTLERLHLEIDSLVSKIDRGKIIDLRIPKFEFQWNGNLTTTLQRMGVNAPFVNTDFSYLFAHHRDINIEQVKSFGFIGFNEVGLVGGGGPDVIESSVRSVNDRGSQGKGDLEIVFDRPFVLIVRDNELKMPLLESAIFWPGPASSSDPSRKTLYPFAWPE